jgi:superfamily II DNA or RNA helicase
MRSVVVDPPEGATTLQVFDAATSSVDDLGQPCAISAQLGTVKHMTATDILARRPVMLTREGAVFRLAFRYDPDIVTAVRTLPGAHFDGDTKTWTASVCAQSVDKLRSWFLEGWCDVAVDDLLGDGETLSAVRYAVLRAGSLRRPYLVHPQLRDETLFAKLRTVPGATWDKKAQALTYPPTAGAALAELVDRGIVEDPDRLLSPAEVVVSFDARTGGFSVRGDERASAAFSKSFPAHDVVAVWKGRGVDVAFADEFTAEVYRSERARGGDGLQPAGMKLDLFPYQAQTVAVAIERSGLGVFHAMGLGKTATAIGVGLELCTNRREVPRTVVVAPGAVRTQWAEEIRRFTGQDDIVIIDGDKKKREKLYAEAAESRWMIVHYDVLHLDLDKIAPLVSGSLLVSDEAHRLKSPTAKRTKAMRNLAQKADRRLALSGTPIESDPGEWYSLISGFVQPGCFGSPQDFLNRYSWPGRFGGWEGARNLGELRERSKAYYIRFTKEQVATHLPPLRVSHRPLDVDAAYANALKRAHRDAREEIRRAALERAAKSPRANGVLDGEFFDEVESGADMTAVGALKWLCLSPRLLWRSDAPSAKAMCEAGIVPDEDGPKLDELRLLVAELQATNQRVVVFTSSKKMVDLVAERFDEDKIRYVCFTGDTSRADRDAAVAAFTSPGVDDDDPGPTVFLATDAGGEGLNLGRSCSLLVNLDIPWTPGALAQRSARIHRIDGTAESYLVINLTLKGTIEEGILKLVERKADLVDAVFGEMGGRRKTTGRGGRSAFDEALSGWVETDD